LRGIAKLSGRWIDSVRKRKQTWRNTTSELEEMKFNCDQREFGFDRREEIYEAARPFPRSTALCLYPLHVSCWHQSSLRK
jgi:hypothetical protein